MTPKIRKWPTKGQAVVMGIIMLLWLASNWVSMLFEGRAATGFYWAIQSLNIVFLAVCMWMYMRAAKHPTKLTQ